MRRSRGRQQGQSNAVLMRLGFLLVQQIQQMERKPPVTIALVLCMHIAALALAEAAMYL